jgi:hypothetical protein
MLDACPVVGHSSWVPKPVLNTDEHEIATYRSNRSQGNRAVGGHLLLTDQRVLFYPHKLDSSTGGRNWECDLASITSVGLSERGRNPFNGSMRRRLKIDSDGATEFFVVNKAESIAAAIRTATGR